MEVLYLLIPLSLILVALIALVFLWSVSSGQYDDLEGPAHRILRDDPPPLPEEEDTTGGRDGDRS